MKKIQIKKGYTLDYKIDGIVKDTKSSFVSLTPSKIPFIKPKLVLKKGETVKIGTKIFFDKRDKDVVFLSPVNGEIKDIVYGDRRVIRQILIKVTGDDSEEFDKVEESKISSVTREDLENLIVKGGLWSLFRKLPFRDYPKRAQKTPKIIVNLNTSEIEGPKPGLYLKGNEKLFLFGLKVLEKFSENICIAAGDKDKLPAEIEDKITYRTKGPYPSSDSGVILYHTKKRIPENESWYIYGQDLLKIASLLLTGRYPSEKIVTVSGSPDESDNKHFRVKEGTPLEDMIKIPEGVRIVQGGVFNGYISDEDPFTGMFSNSFTLIESEGDDELFGFVTPGLRKRSVSRAFLNFSGKKELDSSLNGEERACVNCGTCSKYCPVDMFPNITYKAVYADDPEEAAFTGLLDCVECGLCSFVCPSKIELSSVIKKAREEYYKEQV